MSPKYSLLALGLTALAWTGFAATRADDPPAPGAPSGLPSAQEATSSPRVLLLSNGRLLQGEISREGDVYVLRQNGGTIRIHESQVEDAFNSIEEIYKYKLARIPRNDPDEHLKLARWCLGQNMPGEAKHELERVVEVSPNSREAKAMLASIVASEETLAAKPRMDPGLIQTGAEVSVPGDGRPSEIDAAVLRKARRELGVAALPIIFDLPPALAVKRADQFARLVHPVLQVSCAKCHNEKYRGSFQLIEVKRSKDLTPDVYRANLDATLRLINPDDLVRSELLSSSLLPHGSGSNKRPIFRGSNDRGFQILSAWTQSLRDSSAVASRAPEAAPFGPVGAARSPGFAVDRARITSAPNGPAYPDVSVTPSSALPPPSVIPPTRYKPGEGFIPETAPPSEDEFPLPFAVSGQLPKPAAPGRAEPSRPGVLAPMPSNAPGLPAAAAPAAAEPDPSAPPAEPKSADADVPAKPKKPVKIDPSLLERMLKGRNGGR